MKKKVLALTAVMALGIFSATAANDNVTFSKPVRLLKPNVESSFEKDFEWNDVDYSVKEKNNQLIFEFNDNKFREKHDIKGYHVTGAEIGDLNGDNYPEIFVYLKADEMGNQMKLIGYSSNNGKSMSQVYLPQPDEVADAAAYQGFRGFDEMSIVENNFCRRFPVIENKDGALYMNGMMRQIQYKLVDGEACRRLEIDRYYEYPIMMEK